ncbi:MAG TPA: hypothetical protein VGU46_04105 [Acidobacteriaceae bacterium]|nr:hypothetical protein [Acidobacteriaceae bacterium]
MRSILHGQSIWACIGIALILGLIGGRHAAGQALPTATGPGAYVIVGATYSGFESSYGEQKISGASFYVDTNFIWRYGLETEVRRMAYPHFGERQSTLLTGPRWSFRPKGFVPYAKFLVGGGRFDFPYGFGYGNYFVVAPGAGVDLRVGQKVRLRLVDFEYQQWPGFTYGPIHPYGVSAGISFEVLGSGRTKLSR